MTFRDQLEELRLTPDLDFEASNERLGQAGLSDGLPLVPPTPQRLEAMLSGWQAHPHAGLDMQLMPSFVTPSLWDIAANAVMAGCRRDYLPVVVAALWAMSNEEYNMLGVQATTGSAAPVIVVHGPIAGEIGVHGGENCFGPGYRANASIGRAVSLVLRNVGGAIPGIGDMATLGQPGKYGWCFAENEAASPFRPFHTTRGLDAGTNAVTVLAASGSSEVVLTGSSAEDYAACLGRAMPGRRRDGEVMVVLPPEPANLYANQGWDRERWRTAICESQLEGRGVASTASLLLVVAGGLGIKSALIPGWGTSAAVTQPVEAL